MSLEKSSLEQRRVVRILLGSIVVLILIIVALVGVGALLITRSQPAAVQVVVATPTPQPTATAQPAPTAIPATATPTFLFGDALASDDFTQPDRSLFRAGKNEHASYEFTGRAYSINVVSPQYIAWSPLHGTFTDGAIEADVNLASGPAETSAGIVFRYQDEQNFYFFGVSGDGYYVLAVLNNGTWTQLFDWTISPQVQREGSANRLRVEMAGDRFRVYVNGTLLDEARDTTFRSGGIALAVNTFDQGNATVLFKNFVIYKPK